MKVWHFKSNSIILALVGIVMALALLLAPLPLVQLMGAVVLVALPGYWAWRLLGFQESIFSPFTWAAITFATLAIVPLVVNAMGLLFGSNYTVITTTLAAATLFAAFFHQRQRTAHADRLLDIRLPSWIYALLVGLGLFLAFMVVMTYVPIKTIKGLPWVTMGDWDKHGALIWALVETGVPPEDIFIGSTPSLTLSYYYFFHLISAILHILTHQHFSFRPIFVLPTAALAFSFPLLLFNLAYSLFKRVRSALLTTYFVTWIGGLDLVAVWFLIGQQDTPRLDIDSWKHYLNIDSWAPPTGSHINIFYAYFIWVPHHLAALALLIVAWLLWMRRPQWRVLRFWAPLLFASMVGYSVYVAIAALAGLSGWLAWEVALGLKNRSPSWRMHWKTWTLRGLRLVLATVVLAAPMLWLYWQGRTPGRGVAFASPALAVDKVWPCLAQAPLDALWLRPFHFLLQYALDLGVGLFLVAFGIYITVRMYSSLTWADKQPILQPIICSSSWRWMFSTGIISLALISFFVSSGVTPESTRSSYATLNDFSMRVIMPLQIVIGLLAPMFVIWWSRRRGKRYLLPLVVVGALLVVPGVGATVWEVWSMTFAKYEINWAISYPYLQALDYVRSHAPKDMRFQQPVDQPSEAYLLARRRPVLWGRTAPILSADQPRAFRLLKTIKEAYETKDPARSAQLFAENDVDLILVTARERAPYMNPDKFTDGDHFQLVFDNGWVQIYQVGSKMSIPQQITLTAQAKQARKAGDLDRAEKLYEDAAAEAASQPGLLKDILMEWGITERFDDPEKAASLFKQVLALDPDYGEARANYGMVLLNLGRIDEAIAVLTKLVAEHPGHYWGWRLLGSAYEKQELWNKAQVAYQNATDAAQPGSKDQSVMVMGILRSAVHEGQCEQAKAIAQLYTELLEAQSEEVTLILTECQK